MTSMKKHTVTKLNDGTIELEFAPNQGLELEEKQPENAITSMSDAAIVAANETLDKELVWAKNFRYAPTVHTADILKNTIESTGFDKNDIVTIALLVLESATREQLINATNSLMQDKSLALFTSLSK